MSPAELEAFLHAEIPLSQAMGLRVLRADADGVCLQAPLQANHNHEGVAFGGSIAALGALAGWCLLRLRLGTTGAQPRIVIRRQQLDCFRPLTADLRAETAAIAAADWQAFCTDLETQGKARLTLVSTLSAGGEEAARVAGEYVALRAL